MTQLPEDYSHMTWNYSNLFCSLVIEIETWKKKRSAVSSYSPDVLLVTARQP